MKTQDAIQRAGGTGKLARLIGVTPAAVSQWPEDVPQAREWQLRLIRPEWFYQTQPKEANNAR